MSNGHATSSSNSPLSDQEVFVNVSEDSGYRSLEPPERHLKTKHPPKSPNAPVRAYLPNKQRTSVSLFILLYVLFKYHILIYLYTHFSKHDTYVKKITMAVSKSHLISNQIWKQGGQFQ